MVTKLDRKGKAYGGGFYDYPEGGKKTIWPGLKAHYAKKGYKEVPFEDIKDRLVFSQVIEAVKAMEEGVIESIADGNIGSIMGIGFPPHVGGVYQCINHWGAKNFVARANELAKKYGKRFEPPKLLKDKAKKNEQFV